jgi:hypothetical protein
MPFVNFRLDDLGRLPRLHLDRRSHGYIVVLWTGG